MTEAKKIKAVKTRKVEMNDADKVLARETKYTTSPTSQP